MTSALLLSYPHIPFDAKVRTATTGSASADRPIGNTICGERYQYCQATGAGNIFEADWDLGSGYTSTCDHLIVANAAKILGQGADTVRLYSSSDASAYSQVYSDNTAGTFKTASLVGPDSLDYVAYSLGLATNRAWRYRNSGVTMPNIDLCKVYFGNAWDPGKDPSRWTLARLPTTGGHAYTEDGGCKLNRLSDPRYTFSVSWANVSDANTYTFYDRFMRYWQQHKYFLFTTTDHRILNNMKLLHVRFVDEPKVERKRKIVGTTAVGANTISCNFQEVRG